LESNRQYYNLWISRFWIPLRDKDRAIKIALQLKEIWRGRDVVIVEGKETRMGVGNDLLSDVKSCRRILCPARNAYNKYADILNAAKTFPKDSLFLIALGPTATILAYDLYKEGYQAIDIGHVDLEYEWMKAGASEIIKINNRYVNEVDGGDIVDRCEDKNYIAEIIKVID
jgi:glycosyltransferase family protein